MVYHIFPAKLVLHVPYMIDILNRYSHDIGVAGGEQVFYLYGTLDTDEDPYEGLEIPAERLRVRRDMRLDSSLLDQLKQDDILIIHSAFYRGMWRSLLLRPRVLKNIAVIFWGGDLLKYGDQLKRTAFVQFKAALKQGFRQPGVREYAIGVFLRVNRILKAVLASLIDPLIMRIVLPRLGAICTGTPGEFRMLTEWYGPCENYVPFVFHTNVSDLRPSPEAKTGNVLRVLLGNSGALSNDHLEVLPWLARFKAEGIQVICPLGYPPPSPYTQNLIETGKTLLGDRFIPLLEVLPKTEYSALLESIDVFILNAKRQQGAYCVFSSLLSGKKVYLSTVSPMYQMMVDWGIKVFDVRDIESASFDDFASFPREDAMMNHEISQQHFSLHACLRTWKALIGRMKNGTN
jgi:hypothetical protein